MQLASDSGPLGLTTRLDGLLGLLVQRLEQTLGQCLCSRLGLWTGAGVWGWGRRYDQAGGGCAEGGKNTRVHAAQLEPPPILTLPTLPTHYPPGRCSGSRPGRWPVGGSRGGRRALKGRSVGGMGARKGRCQLLAGSALHSPPPPRQPAHLCRSSAGALGDGLGDAACKGESGGHRGGQSGISISRRPRFVSLTTGQPTDVPHPDQRLPTTPTTQTHPASLTCGGLRVVDDGAGHGLGGG